MLTVASAIGGAGGARAAQDTPTAGPHTTFRHHAAERPNYRSAFTAHSLDPIRVPPPPSRRPPEKVRGLYLNGWVFGGSRLGALVALADTTEINTFVIDVKDVTGYLTYRSSVPTAIAIGANGDVRTQWARERLARLRARGIHTVARIVVAKDSLLAEGKPEWAIQREDGGLWHDRFGAPWVDAFRDSVWLYAGEIAQEAVLMGFAEVQFDYVRLPDESAEAMDAAVFPGRRPGESRRQGIARNLRLLRDRVKPMGVPFTVDVFGLTTSARGDMGIGQVWEDMASIADVVLPMVYPSHYGAGAYGYTFPNGEPYGIVYKALADAIDRSHDVDGAATIRPFLQSFSIRRAVYRAAEIRAQIDAVYDHGLTSWVLWNASGRYPADAFLPASPVTAAPEPASSPQARPR